MPSFRTFDATTIFDTDYGLGKGWSSLGRGVFVVVSLASIAVWLGSAPGTTRWASEIAPLGKDGQSMVPITSWVLLNSGAWFMHTLAFMALALLLFARSGRKLLPILAATVLMAFGATAAPFGLVPQRLVAIHDVLQIVGMWGALLLFYLAPNGRFIPRFTLPLAAAWTAMNVLWLVWPAAPMNLNQELAYRRDLPWSLFVGAFFFGSGAVAQVLRFRRAHSNFERDRLRWVSLGLTAAFLGAFLYHSFQFPHGPVAALFASIETRTTLHLLGLIFGGLLQLALPVALLLAIGRYRVVDVDIRFGRATAYGMASISLLLFFGVIVSTTQQLLLPTGDSSWPPAAVSLLTLVSALLLWPMFRRMDQWIRRTVDFHPPAQVSDAEGAEGISTSGRLGRLGSWSGVRIGPWELESPLRHGAQSKVYRAVHEKLGWTAALKVLPDDLSQRSTRRRRFLREARAVAELDHPNIIKIYDCGEAEGILFIATQFVDDGDLRGLVRGGKSVSPSRAVALVSDLGRALEHVHAHDLVHRDVKPSNVLVRKLLAPSEPPREEAVLADFGLVRFLDVTRITQAGTFGTVDYIAPEPDSKSSRRRRLRGPVLSGSNHVSSPDRGATVCRRSPRTGAPRSSQHRAAFRQ